MLYKLQTLVDSPYVLGSAAALLVLTIVIYLVARQPKAFKAFDAEGGGVIVTRKAVRELVQRCCSGLQGVGAAHARVTIHAGEVLVRVALRTRRTANLKGISSTLREEIRVALTENLGIERIRDIEIVVVGILDDSGKED
ncbi:MAG: hypothetical protein IAE82_19770 [Opitutaceae bacterium]|nr:hypothetical protein [Opitutaceae bacterium]